MTVRDWSQALSGELEAMLCTSSGLGEVDLLIPRKDVADDPMKLLVRDARGKPAAVALCAVEVSPDLVARGMAKAREAKRLLGPRFGRVILDPLGEGRIGEIDVASYGRIDKAYLSVRLEAVAEEDCTGNSRTIE